MIILISPISNSTAQFSLNVNVPWNQAIILSSMWIIYVHRFNNSFRLYFDRPTVRTEIDSSSKNEITRTILETKCVEVVTRIKRQRTQNSIVLCPAGQLVKICFR